MNYIKANRKRIVFICLIFILAFLGGAGLGKITDRQKSIMDQVSEGKVVNILLMGIDARSMNENSRSDTMILASIDTKNKKVVLVWIPRDTKIQSSTGHQAKINSVNYVDGPEAACETVGKLLDTEVDNYIITNFWGFSKIIDTLGGVDIDVESNMKHYDPDPYLNINISKGMQHLNGENALKYVRYRGGPTADIGRTQSQAKFLKAVANQAFQSKTILKLPELVPQFMNSIKTNIPLSDLVYLATQARDFENSEIITQTLPGYSFTDSRDGGSYWEADKTIASGIIDALLAGKHFEVEREAPAWVKKASTTSQKVDKETDSPDNNQTSEEGKDDTQTDDQNGQGAAGSGQTAPEVDGGTPGQNPSSPSTPPAASGQENPTPSGQQPVEPGAVDGQ